MGDLVEQVDLAVLIQEEAVDLVVEAVQDEMGLIFEVTVLCFELILVLNLEELNIVSLLTFHYFI